METHTGTGPELGKPPRSPGAWVPDCSPGGQTSCWEAGSEPEAKRDE